MISYNLNLNLQRKISLNTIRHGGGHFTPNRCLSLIISKFRLTIRKNYINWTFEAIIKESSCKISLWYLKYSLRNHRKGKIKFCWENRILKLLMKNLIFSTFTVFWFIRKLRMILTWNLIYVCRNNVWKIYHFEIFRLISKNLEIF